jgi:hypothetical protein
VCLRRRGAIRNAARASRVEKAKRRPVGSDGVSKIRAATLTARVGPRRE